MRQFVKTTESILKTDENLGAFAVLVLLSLVQCGSMEMVKIIERKEAVI